jgi:hypothetical protein
MASDGETKGDDNVSVISEPKRKTRDDEFIEIAGKYLAAQQQWSEAENVRRSEECKANQAKESMQRIEKQLGEFVGANIRTKNAVIDGQIVRVQFVAEQDKPNIVTVESVTQPSR